MTNPIPNPTFDEARYAAGREQERARVNAIDTEFSGDPAFALEAIVAGWSIDKARRQNKARQSKASA